MFFDVSSLRARFPRLARRSPFYGAIASGAFFLTALPFATMASAPEVEGDPGNRTVAPAGPVGMAPVEESVPVPEPSVWSVLVGSAGLLVMLNLWRHRQPRR